MTTQNTISPLALVAMAKEYTALAVVREPWIVWNEADTVGIVTISGYQVCRMPRYEDDQEVAQRICDLHNQDLEAKWQAAHKENSE